MNPWYIAQGQWHHQQEPMFPSGCVFTQTPPSASSSIRIETSSQPCRSLIVAIFHMQNAHVQHKSEGCSLLAELEISCSGNLQTGKFRNNLPKFSWVIHISRFLDLKCTEDLFASLAYNSCQTGKRSLTVLISGKSCISELGWALETSSRGEDVAKNSGHLLLDTSI